MDPPASTSDAAAAAAVIEFSSTKIIMMELCLTKAAVAYPTDGDVLEKVRQALDELPSIMLIDNLTDAHVALRNFFPAWSEKDITRVASVTYKARGTHVNVNSTTFEKGQCAVGSPRDATLPMPVDSAKAEVIWNRHEWDECVQEFNLKRLVEIAHYDGCKFDMLMAEHGAMLSLRDFPPSPLAIGGIIKLHTDIDNVECIGQLINEGELHLRECGPEKQSIALGITDLTKIRWFHLKIDDFPAISQSVTIADARESICGYLHAKPAMLGINMALNIFHLPFSWKVLKHLGSGLTSHVYLVEGSGSRFAVKAPRLFFDLSQDIQYLELLRGVDGVPVVQQKIHRMIVLKPICASFSVETLFECGTLELADLIETIRCAHERGIVNRDLRIDNIMIGESLYNTGKIRFFILDWGFAAKTGLATGFSGSVITASDKVLGQLCHGFSQVTVSVNDDLVSLVPCLFLIFNCKAISVLHTLKEKPKKIIHFWQQHLEKSSFWRKAQGDALQLQYDGLKELFQTSTQEDLIEV